MSFKDTLDKAMRSASPVLHTFITDYPKYPNYIHCFFEGHDDPSFYVSHIERNINHNNIRRYKCGNKDEVYKLYDMVMQRAKSSDKFLFFVDKDLSDILNENIRNENNIYVTEFYSIENYIVNEDTLRMIIDDLFCFSSKDLNGLNVYLPAFDVEFIIREFKKSIELFYEFMLYIMACSVFIRRKKLKINLRNLTLSNLVIIDQNLMFQRKKSIDDEKIFNEIARSCQTQVLSIIDIKEIINELSQISPKLYVRGKFEIWFFVDFIKAAKKYIENRAKVDNFSLTVNIDFNKANILTILSPRIPTPDSLVKFLKTNL